MVAFAIALVKEDNRKTEQTFHVAIGISDSILAGVIPATSESEAFLSGFMRAGAIDGLQTIIFEPYMEKEKYIFIITADEIVEGREGFVIFSLLIEGSTIYQTPNMLSTVFRSATGVIEDSDCKHWCDQFCGLVYQIYFY